MRRKTIAMMVLLLAGGLLLSGCRNMVSTAPGQGVSRRYQDVDGDGLPEVILENEYLHLSVMTGEMPTVIPEPDVLPDGRKVPYKYGDRFARGGWIYNMVFKPTGRKWFINDITQGEHRHGIPEEFEITALMKEVEPGMYAAMKPSVGTGIGPGLCFRNTMHDMKNPPWKMQEECLVNGVWRAAGESDMKAAGWRLTFTHAIDTEYGYGCAYKKVMTLMEGESALRCHRELTNTGVKDFMTTWYTHGFFAQGKDGWHDRHCWSVIPLCPPRVKGSRFPSNLLDVERGFVHAFGTAYYWGAKSYDEIGGNWHACGNDESQDVFVTMVDPRPKFTRMWTCDMTYSYEPFMVFEVLAGKTTTWETVRATGNGLTSVKASGAGGMLDWRVSVGKNNSKMLNLQFLPYKAIEGRIALNGKIVFDKATVAVDRVADVRISPLKPWQVTVEIPNGMALEEAPHIQLSVSVDDKPLVTADARYHLNVRPRTAWNGDAKGAKGVVLADVGKDDKGAYKHNMSTKFAEGYLGEAGFKMSLSTAMGDGGELDWKNLKLVVLASRRISMPMLRKLEAFAANGGGVIVTGMIDHRQFELSDLLPVKGIYGENNTYARNPRDGTLEFVDQDNYRYQVKAVGTHEITAGLPWYPESYQSIGAFQRVVPKEDAQVLLNFTAGPGMADAGQEYPALLLRNYGKGKVAYWGCPIAWGGHQSNCMWGLLGEYHQKFFVQMALSLIGTAK